MKMSINKDNFNFRRRNELKSGPESNPDAKVQFETLLKVPVVQQPTNFNVFFTAWRQKQRLWCKTAQDISHTTKGFQRKLCCDDVMSAERRRGQRFFLCGREQKTEVRTPQVSSESWEFITSAVAAETVLKSSIQSFKPQTWPTHRTAKPPTLSP